MKVIDFIIMKFKYFMLMSFLFLLFYFLFTFLHYPEILDNNGVQGYFKVFFTIVFFGFIINTYARRFFPENFERRSGFIVRYIYILFILLGGLLYVLAYFLPRVN